MIGADLQRMSFHIKSLVERMSNVEAKDVPFAWQTIAALASVLAAAYHSELNKGKSHVVLTPTKETSNDPSIP